jgi:type VI secretion system protein ImpK
MAEASDQKQRLADLCTEILAFAFRLRGGQDPGSAGEAKQALGTLFVEYEQAARAAGYRPEAIQAAKYAMVAFLDELILSSKWPMKEEWAGNPLQLEYFNDFAAGEEFYHKLKGWQSGNEADRAAVLEVYFLCLTHGFKGMYIDLKGMEERKSLSDALAAELRSGRAGSASNLSPSWEAPDELPKLVRSTPTWVIPIVCLAVLILLVLALAVTTNFVAEGAASRLASGAESAAPDAEAEGEGE